MGLADATFISDKDTTNLMVKASEALAELTRQLLQVKPFIIIAFSGNNNLTPLFETFKERNDIPWQDIHIFSLSEKLLKIDSEFSNFKIMYDGFIRYLQHKGVLDLYNVHPFSFTGDIQSDLQNYINELLKFGDRFDITVSQLGDDGSIADLYPNHHTIKDTSQFFLAMDDAPFEPFARMSASKSLIKNSAAALLFAVGESKKSAYLKFRNETLSEIECPAKLILNLASPIILTDLD